MALNFPDSPSDGDTFNGYSYNSSKGAWVSSSLNNTGPIVSDTAPSNPINGDFWFDSSSGRLYMRYDDGSSSQWLSLSSSGADGAPGADGTATVYANTSVLPSSGNVVGSLAFATLTKSLHVWDGTEWDRVSTGNNETPRLTTTPASSLNLEADGSTSQLVIAAEDPEGFPITYSHDTNPSNPNQVTNITNSGGTFTLTPSTNQAHEGNFTLRLKASDGVSTTSHAVAVNLGFSPANTFKTLYIAHTSGTIREVTGGADEANATNLDTMITSTANNGDLILLNPASGSTFGHFKITHDTGDDAYSVNPFANKQIAIVGGGLKPNNIFVWHDHDGTTGRRDHPIFQRSWTGSAPTDDAGRALTYRQFMFNLTYHRHQTSTTNYENSITRSPMGGGTMLNCIIDFNNGEWSWRYDNSSQSVYRVSYKHCTFLNYSGVDSPFTGNNTAIRVIDCAFENGSNRVSSDTTAFGTNQESVNFDGWKYDNYTTKNIEITSAIANGTYGHLKDLNSLTSTNTLFNTYQSAN